MSSPNDDSDAGAPYTTDDDDHHHHDRITHFDSDAAPREHDEVEETFMTANEHVPHTPSPPGVDLGRFDTARPAASPGPDVDFEADNAFHTPGKSLDEELREEEDMTASDMDNLPDMTAQSRFPMLSTDLGSPLDSGSIPDDTPSLQGSFRGSQLSLPLRPGLSPRSSLPRTPSGALQPFERRFASRFSSSPSPSPRRAASPAFLSPHSRHSSMSSHLPASDTSELAETPEAPWDVVRWTKLKKITGQAFSEVGKRNFGSPTCLAVTSIIAIGTSKGLILIFDYHQILKSIIGQATKAIESGAITSLAIAADHSTIAGGHASGNIFTWEIARPARPFLHIPPVSRTDGATGRDGHVPGRSVLHIGFLGTRHTALVSADDGGMAFSHLATRGLGAVTRSVKSTRLLGRYPLPPAPEKPLQKPSSVLALAPLPLGNVEQLTDEMGLTALLTPYLLVIVSTTPIAQTQHKASRPKDLHAHGALSGCLAWFPSVKLKTAKGGKANSNTKLVYCWSNILTVLDVEARQPESSAGKDKPPELYFQSRSRWRCEEAIVAVQWLSRSVIGVLTISQQMIILEDPSLHVMESVDLLQKQIYHLDLFSGQLHQVVEQTDNEHSELHGVIADAFYQSFRVYKGRIFLLGVSDVSIGVVSNWADRLTALLEHGDNIAAIRLAKNYWTGESGGVTVGMPEDPQARHALVGDRVLELITASITYTLSEASEDRPLRALVVECFDACVTMDEQDFLFDQVYEPLKDAGQGTPFLDILETYIMDEEINFVPPPVVKDLVELFVDKDDIARLEEILCRLDPRTLDLDQITTLCKMHFLYDALIFVWNEALQDYVTPFMDLLALIRDTKDTEMDDDDIAVESARKIFPYMAFALTGRKYPQGDFIDEDEADNHKTALYKQLFADEYVAWPTADSPKFSTRLDGTDGPSFPYLTLLLEYDTASFMSMMSEAFEDPFLNGGQEAIGDGPLSNGSGVKITRQHIVSILLDVMADSGFAPEHTIYLDMFIARNLPKYPQFMILSGSQLQHVLDRLCTFRSDDLTADCQLSVEYLLSVYHPSVTPTLIEQLRDARFYRVLKSLYRAEQRFVDLISIYFEDPYDKQELFHDLSQALKVVAPQKQATQVKQLLYDHADDIATINTPQTARTLARFAPDTLDHFVDALKETYHRFIFLRTLLEPSRLHGSAGRAAAVDAIAEEMTAEFCEQYVQLMCIHDPRHVAEYIGILDSGDLNLDKVLPAMEKNGVIDAAVLLLAQDGLARDAIDRLCKHMLTLQNALCGLIEAATSAPDPTSTEETANDLTAAVDKYVRLGMWLCQGQTAAAAKSRRPRPRTNVAWDVHESDLDLDEQLWLDLLDSVVALSKAVTSETVDIPISDYTDLSTAFDLDKVNNTLRGTVQSAFTALLASTSSTPDTQTSLSNSHQHRFNQSFLRVFRAFLSRASNSYAPTLSDLRKVLLDIFTAYTHESSVLTLASQLLDQDVFTDVNDIRVLRQRGWRPKTQVCELCKRRAWGTGTMQDFHFSDPNANANNATNDDEPRITSRPNHQGTEIIWREWQHMTLEAAMAKTERTQKKREQEQEPSDNRGKGKRPSVAVVHERSPEEVAAKERGTLVVFACRHVFHRACLDSRIKERHESNNIRGGARNGGAVKEGNDAGDDDDDDEREGYWCPFD